MSNIVFGKDMILQAKVEDEYTAIGCAATCSFEFENELIFKTDVNAGLFRKKRVRMSDCRASAQGLFTLENDTTISALYFLQEGVRRTEQDLRFLFTDEQGVLKQIQGMFLVASVNVTGDVSAFSEFDLNFEGTGGFTISSVDDSSAANLPGDVNWDWWETVEGETTITGNGNYGRSFVGHEVISVFREGTQYDLVESGTPSGRQAKQADPDIEFDPALPFPADVRVYVVWQEAL
jgi:predicted secreted protein